MSIWRGSCINDGTNKNKKVIWEYKMAGRKVKNRNTWSFCVLRGFIEQARFIIGSCEKGFLRKVEEADQS